MQISLVHTRLRHEERMLLDAAKDRGIAIEAIRDADLVLSLDGDLPGDVVLARSVSATRGLYLLRACRAAGHPSVNRFDTAATCMDKAETSFRLRQAGIPTPDTYVAFDAETALDTMDRMGYPVVLKPTVGSWARLVSRADDRFQAQQLLEHREALPNPQQHVYYMQRYVDTRNGMTDEQGNRMHKDIRAFVVGDETIAAIERVSPSWVTNTARGARAQNRPISEELADMCARAAQAVGGGVVAIDAMEGPDGLVIHEVNHTMEFRNSVEPTGVDIPGAIIEYCVAEARR